MVTTGLERDVKIRTSGPRTGVKQGCNLGVRSSSTSVESLSYNSSIANNHAAHPRIGVGKGGTLARQAKRHAHVVFRRLA